MSLHSVTRPTQNSLELTYDGPTPLSEVAAMVVAEAGDLLREPLGVSGEGQTLIIHRDGSRPDFSVTSADGRHFQLTEMGILAAGPDVLRVIDQLRARFEGLIGKR